MIPERVKHLSMLTFRPSTDRIFSSRMVRKRSPFNLFNNLGGGGTTGSAGATGGCVGVGTSSVVGIVAAEGVLVAVD